MFMNSRGLKQIQCLRHPNGVAFWCPLNATWNINLGGLLRGYRREPLNIHVPWNGDKPSTWFEGSPNDDVHKIYFYHLLRLNMVDDHQPLKCAVV